MLTRFGEFDRTFSLLDDLRRRMDRVWDDFEPTGAPSGSSVWPRLNVYDAGATLVLQCDVPGMNEKEIQLTLNGDAFTIAGERKTQAREGYATHRQERAPVKFSRSLTLPCVVDAEKTTATLKDGVLTITLAKAAEAQPRQIAIRPQ